MLSVCVGASGLFLYLADGRGSAGALVASIVR